jgi:hypothetical protein
MTTRELADAYLQPYKAKGDEFAPVYCPFCHGGQNRDKYTFALNVEKQTYNCRRGSCGAQGHFVDLCRHFGVQADKDIAPKPYAPQKRYKTPEKKPVTLTDAAMGYLQQRCISRETAGAYCVGVDESGNLQFPYYDENGQHVFNKFRVARKLDKGERKMWREADTKPVLFGMNLCNPELPLCVCEGELDAMACHESGIPNAVSVPSGAEDFTWVDTCWDFLGRFDRIFLFGDNDEPGNVMIRKLTAKLADHRLYIVKHECKDANELLFRKGKTNVFDAWINAAEVPVTGLIRLADVVPLDVRNMPKARTSIKALDGMLGGFMMGDVTVWTGRRGDGKSTVLSQVLLDAIRDGRSVCAYSGELRAERFQYWTDLQAAGRDYVREYYDDYSGRTVRYLDREIRDKIHEWYQEQYWMYDNTAIINDEESGVIKIFEQAAKRYDCTVFLIDNLMTVDYGRSQEKDFNLQQTRFVNQLAAFANLHNVHIHLVAHPRKTSSVTDSDEVSGTGNITNRAANVISVNRSAPENGGGTTLKVLKNRWEGTVGDVKLFYDEKSHRTYEFGVTPNEPYGWQVLTANDESESEVLPF